MHAGKNWRGYLDKKMVFAERERKDAVSEIVPVDHELGALQKAANPDDNERWNAMENDTRVSDNGVVRSN